MHESGSFLYTAIEIIRRSLEQAATDKYNDDYLARYLLGQAYSECLVALNMNSDDVVIAKTLITVAVGTSSYTLPPIIENVLRIIQRDSTGYVMNDIRPENLMHPLGPGWRLEANEITFDPAPIEAVTWEMQYIPSGDCLMHYGTGAVTDLSTIVLAASPDVGLMDRRPNAYVGSILRILTSGRAWQERIIATHNVATRVVTTRIPFTDLPAAAAPVTYEIAPLGHQPVWQMMARKAALILGEERGVEASKLLSLDKSYQRARKAAFDRLSNIQARTGKSLTRFTMDNTEAALDLWRVGQRTAS